MFHREASDCRFAPALRDLSRAAHAFFITVWNERRGEE
jgi:hypothetical protein